jgi:hypothetical protein
MQEKFILDLKLRTVEEVENMSKKEATKLLIEEVPKFHARKLLEWGIKSKEDLAKMLPNELKKLYTLHGRLRKIDYIKSELAKYEIGEVVWLKQVVNKERIKTKCSITAVRYPKARGSYINHLSQNITVRLPNGKKKAVDLNKIEKVQKKNEEEK